MHELEMSGWSGLPTLVNDPHGLLQGHPPAQIATVLSLPPGSLVFENVLGYILRESQGLKRKPALVPDE